MRDAIRRWRATAVVAVGLFAGAAFTEASVLQDRIEGKVIAVDGSTVTAQIPGGLAPAVGDRLSVMKVLGEGSFAYSLGNWRITAVQGQTVTAVFVSGSGERPQVGLLAVVTLSQNDSSRDGGSTAGGNRPGVKGKVTEVRGRSVSIRLDSPAAAAVGDRVELSFTYDADTIAVGTWRVSAVRADGRLEAEPVEALGEPSPGLDAIVWASGTPRDAKTADTSSASTPDVLSADRLAQDGLQAWQGRGVPKDEARAVELFVKAAEQGHAAAAEWAAYAYRRGQGVALDYARAAVLYRQAAEAGRAESQNNYGACLATGRGVPKDVPQAVQWYLKAAAQGHAQAQDNLCYLYETGDGVEKNVSEALRFCRLAAEQNNSNALDRLGRMYQLGSGVGQDLSQAFEFYRRAAELGHANGQNNLGYAYELGWGGKIDYEQALYWYRKSAAQGSAWAEWNLGRMHQDGVGVARDQATAIAHFQRAARGGHESAQQKLRQLGQSW